MPLVRQIINKVRATVAAARRSFKNAGVLRTAQRAVQRVIPTRIFEVNQVVVIDTFLKTTLDERQGAPLNPDFQYRWATGQDLDLLTCGGHTRAEVQEYFAGGGRAVITTSGDEMVGYYWAIPERWDSYGWLRFTMAAKEFWGGHNFVAPAFRGKKIAGETRDFAYGQLLSEGYERAAGSVQVLNRSSLRVWSGPANRVLGRIFYIRLVDLIIYRIGGTWGAGFYGGGRPLEFSLDDFHSVHQRASDTDA